MPTTRIAAVSVLALLLIAADPARTGDFDDSAVSKLDYPDWFEDSFLDLQSDLEEALDADKLGLMVLLGTEGCSYCAEFIRASLEDPRLGERVRSHFDAVSLEIFSDAEMVGPGGDSLPVKAFAQREGAGMAPSLLFYGEGSRPLYRGIGYHSPERFAMVLDYLIGGHFEHASFRDFAQARQDGAEPSSQPYHLLPDPLFGAPPYALDRSRVPAQRPLLVIFEGKDCADCPRLHQEVLALPEVRELLARFELVRLDAGDDETPVLAPDGHRTTPARWYAQAGFSALPALLLFEEGGREVLGTDTLVLRQRMMNALLYTLERAYEKDWTYQRFARSKALERLRP